jgi:DNA-binding winged helix-turn-helix (wHTH) protein
MILDFETFRVDFDSRQVFRGAEEVHLTPKAMQLLQALIEARPKALARTEIFEQLWPDTFVADSNLATIVNEIRRALGDDAHSPRYVRTVHGFGYAFCGEPSSEAAAPRGAALARLVWDGGDEPLFSGRNVIGRDAGARVRIDDRTISRHHAAIVIQPGTTMLEDLNSKNGTYCDGIRVSTPVRLSDGSVVEVGSVKTIYREISGLSTTTHLRD